MAHPLLRRIALLTTLALPATFLVSPTTAAMASTASAATASSGTTVGGILHSDTEWTRSASPYVLSSVVQIPAGVTLTIDPGVTVEGNIENEQPLFTLNGSISAVGTASDPITIHTGQSGLIYSSGSGTDMHVTLQHAQISADAAPGGLWEDGGGGSIQLLDSVVTGMEGSSDLPSGADIERNVFHDDWSLGVLSGVIEQNVFDGGGLYVSSGVIEQNVFDGGDLSVSSGVIERNVFYGGQGLWIGDGTTVRNNRFEGAAAQDDYWVYPAQGSVQFDHNSFDSTAGVRAIYGCDTAIDATYNDWGTADGNVIESMIYDENDDIDCTTSVSYEPILDGPDPATPAGRFFSTQPPSITGNATVGSTLKASAGTWGPSPNTNVTYQWNDDGTPIPGATSTAYTVAPGDLGHRITVSITVARANYTTATFTSAPTGAVKPGTPTISGTVQVGSTVTAHLVGLSPADATITYQWLAAGMPISGATSQSLLIPSSLAGKSLSVQVTAKDNYAAETAESAAQTVALGTIQNTAVPSISGAVAVGSTVTAVPGQWAPTGLTFTYQWLAEGSPISGATKQSLLIPESLNFFELSLRVTASKIGFTNSTATSATHTVEEGTIKNKPVAISGTVRVGSTVTAVTGKWTNYDLFDYTWLVDGVERGGNLDDQSRYTITPDMVGRKLAVRVTDLDSGYYNSATATSAAQTVAPGIIKNTIVPAISGTVRVGATMKAVVGRWTPSIGLTYAYQWLANGIKIAGAAHSAYTITPAVVGRTLSLTVTASSAGYTTSRATSTMHVIAVGVFAHSTLPKITGTAKAGYTLTASKGAWTPTPSAYGYQWLRSGAAISGARSATYKLTGADTGKQISVRVTVSATGYTPASAISAVTARIAAGSFVNTVLPKITGTPKVGYTLTASKGTWTPTPSSYAYQWLRTGAAITGATASTYRPVAADVGRHLSVRVTARATGYLNSTKVSATTAVVLK